MDGSSSGSSGSSLGLVAALALVLLLTVMPLIVIYDAPARNALDEVVNGMEGQRMSIFEKARQGLNLTPGQRAALKLIEGLVVAFLVAAAPVVADALSSHGTVVWGDALRTALAAGAVAVALSVKKYLTAQGDSPLNTVAENLLQNFADKLTIENGLNEPAVEPPQPEPPTDGPAASAALQPAA